jgi:hypothetical protein
MKYENRSPKELLNKHHHAKDVYGHERKRAKKTAK